MHDEPHHVPEQPHVPHACARQQRQHEEPDDWLTTRPRRPPQHADAEWQRQTVRPGRSHVYDLKQTVIRQVFRLRRSPTVIPTVTVQQRLTGKLSGTDTHPVEETDLQLSLANSPVLSV